MKPISPSDRVLIPMLSRLAGVLSGKGAGARLFILIYHQVLDQPDPMRPGEIDVAQFARQLALLSKYFRVLPLREAVHHLQEGTLPRRAVSITFDDGYRNNYTNALPILEEHGVVATFFIATGFLDNGRMWNDTVIETFRSTSRDTVDLSVFGGSVEESLTDMPARMRAAQQVIDAIKHLPYEDRARHVEEIATLAEELPENLMMTPEQVRQMHDRGMEIGAHTVSHPILSRLDEGNARREIEQSRKSLESLLEAPVDLFAYPNGKYQRDYTERDVRLVRAAGFKVAVSTNPGASSMESEPLELCRFTPWDRNPARFVARMGQYYRKGCGR